MMYTPHLFVAILALITSCSELNQKLGLKDDNVVEETAEFVIDKELGVDVDLTPASKE